MRCWLQEWTRGTYWRGFAERAATGFKSQFPSFTLRENEVWVLHLSQFSSHKLPEAKCGPWVCWLAEGLGKLEASLVLPGSPCALPQPWSKELEGRAMRRKFLHPLSLSPRQVLSSAGTDSHHKMRLGNVACGSKDVHLWDVITTRLLAYVFLAYCPFSPPHSPSTKESFLSIA